MKTFLKAIIIILAILIIIFLAYLLGFRELFRQYIVIHECKKYENELMRVVEYMKDSEHDTMYITNRDIDKGAMVHIPTMGTEYIPIDDFILKDLHLLFDEHSYLSISKEKDKIVFLRFSRLKYGQGLMYSFDGSTPEYDLLIKMKHIKGSWYYYAAE